MGTASASYGENNADAKWVSNQTSIIATNGGNIKLNETLTNTGAIIASINEPLNIEAKKLVTEDLKDYNNSENYNIGFSGIELNGKNHIPQTSVSYGSSDKEQNTNATFSNVNVTENGVKVDLEARGINTDLTKAQVITKDEVVEQIDTMLQTDLLNTGTRAAFVDSVEKAADGLKDIGNALSNGNLKYEDARTDRYGQYYIETHKGMQELINDPGSKTEEEIKAETKAYIKYLTGKDVEVIITDTGEGSGYLRGDQDGKNLPDVFILDMKQLASGEYSAAFIFGHEGNHTDDHRRDRAAHNEVDSDSSGSRLEEILGDKGKSKLFDLDEWRSKGSNGKALEDGENLLNGEYAGMDIERSSGYIPSGRGAPYEVLNKDQAAQKEYLDRRATILRELDRCQGKQCNAKQKELEKLDKDYKPGYYAEEYYNYQIATHENQGANSGSGKGNSNSGNGKNGTRNTTPPKKPSENQPKPQTNYKESDIENLMLKEGYTRDKYEIVNNPSGGYEIVVYGKMDSKNFDSFNNSNISVVGKKDRMGTMQVLTIAAIEKGMAPEYYNVSMQEQMYWQNNGSLQNGVLTYKGAYELGYLTKSEYDSTKFSSLFTGVARGSEYLGYAYAGKSIYDYHLAGQGNQTSSILITGKESNPNMGDNVAKNYATNATVNPKSDSLVLGKYETVINEEGIRVVSTKSYNSVAEQKNATYFQIDNWGEISAKYGNDQMWKINENFLSQQTSLKKPVTFSHDPTDPAYNSGYFKQEIDYLKNKNYEILKGEDYWYAIPKK